ncbi:MAG: hypothetical protein QXW98_06600 [Candidatus Caldarchaeum sp.]
MEYKLFKPSVKPRIFGVISIDPAGHTGILGGTLANDFRVMRSLTAHRSYINLHRELSNYYHPATKAKGNNRSGTGVFMVTKDGHLLFATIRGTTKEMIQGVLTLVDRYGEYDVLPIIERPHPDNVSTNQTASYLAGAFAAGFQTEAIIVSPHRYTYPKREFHRYLRRFGVVYHEPTEHEVDAFLNFYSVIYYDEVGVRTDEPVEPTHPIFNPTESSENETYVIYSDMLLPDVLPSAINVRNHNTEALSLLGEAILNVAKGAISSDELRKIYRDVIKKEKGAYAFNAI